MSGKRNHHSWGDTCSNCGVAVSNGSIKCRLCNNQDKSDQQNNSNDRPSWHKKSTDWGLDLFGNMFRLHGDV